MTDSEPKGCMAAILGLIGIHVEAPATATPALPYRRRMYLFSKAERSFFGVLQQAVGADYLIFAKVRLADLLYVEKGTGSWRSHFNRISAKHLDFVLCDPGSVTPILAIELDDSSHQRKDRQNRDAFVEAAMDAAELPLMRVPVRRSYEVSAVREEIRLAVAPDAT